MNLAEKSELGASIKVYPNPVKDLLNIESQESLQNAQYGIYDLLGKTLMLGDLPRSRSLNIRELPKGVFIFKLDDIEHTYHQKFIKM